MQPIRASARKWIKLDYQKLGIGPEASIPEDNLNKMRESLTQFGTELSIP